MQDILKSVRDREDNGDANVYTELKDLSLPGLLGLEVYDHGDQIPAGVPLANTYDYLIDHWLRPLSSRIPGRARMAREKILRRVVLALCLARIGVCVREDRSPAAIKVDLRLDQLQLPVRQKNDIDTSSRKGKGRQPEALSSPPPSSQLSVDTGFVVEVNLKNSEQNIQASLTTPDPTPSVHSTSSVSSLMAEGEDPACARLRQYTTLESRPHLPSSISKLLSHWVIGADPAHYDWETAERSLHLTSDTESAEDDNRVKIRHRREQRLKQRRGVMAGSASQPNPSRLWASQPQHMESIQGSSQMVDDVVPMSQVERGAFGGRQTSSEHAAKRRKRRAAGF